MVVLEGACETEVGDGKVPVAVDENVLELDITVNDAGVVKALEGKQLRTDVSDSVTGHVQLQTHNLCEIPPRSVDGEATTRGYGAPQVTATEDRLQEVHEQCDEERYRRHSP